MWKKTFVARIQKYGRKQWRNVSGINEREQQYVHMKSQPKKRNMQIAMWERELTSIFGIVLLFDAYTILISSPVYIAKHGSILIFVSSSTGSRYQC